jgi:hypothetical protein
MIFQSFNALVICVIIIILDILFEVTLIYCMLNGVRYRAEEGCAQHSCDVIYN